VFDALLPELTPVRTAVGDSWVLTVDEPDLGGGTGAVAPARLLPSGDAYFLLHGRDREILVPDPDHRAALWTSRVWPGAVLVDGEVVATWRRSDE
jgi:Winged helix DNA-binding domain